MAASSASETPIPLWIKLLYSSFLCVLVPVYWRHYGPANFLWASDLALFFVLAALWLERPLPSSMMAIGVLPFEVLWVVDSLAGSELIGMAAYMFEAERPLYLRALSLFHVLLPVMLLFLLRRLGYDPRALPAQTLLIWIVLPLTYLLTDPADNINLAFGFGLEPQTRVHPLLHLGSAMLLLPALVCWPMHRLMQRWLGPGSAGRQAPA